MNTADIDISGGISNFQPNSGVPNLDDLEEVFGQKTPKNLNKSFVSRKRLVKNA